MFVGIKFRGFSKKWQFQGYVYTCIIFVVIGSLNTIFIRYFTSMNIKYHESTQQRNPRKYEYWANIDKTTVLEANVTILPCNFGRRLYTLRVKGRPPDGWDWGTCPCLTDGLCFVENDIYQN